MYKYVKEVIETIVREFLNEASLTNSTVSKKDDLVRLFADFRTFRGGHYKNIKLST
jgi:hypothetical protein